MPGYRGWQGGEDIDWGKVDSSAPTPMENGLYFGTVAKAEPKPTKDGKPSISLQVEFTSKYDSKEEMRRIIFDTFTVTQEGAFKVKQFCESTGIEPLAGGKFQDVEEFAREIVGVEVWAVIGTRRYEGKDRNRIDEYVHDDHLAEKAAKLNSSSDDAAVPAQGRRRGQVAPAEAAPAAAAPRRSRREAVAPSGNGANGAGDTEDLAGAPAPAEEPRRARRQPRA